MHGRGRGRKATALIAPCDSATDVQPISWQQSRKVTLSAEGDGKQQLQVSGAVQHRGSFSGTNVTKKENIYAHASIGLAACAIPNVLLANFQKANNAKNMHGWSLCTLLLNTE